ncbi:MAG: hypothetical protein HC811_01225 [Flammeovirgaceae bacterium]|nr:hypothetical protein [Flammeovirgaceae bacterium]
MLLALTINVTGQEQTPDSLHRFSPTGIRFGLDLIPPIKTMTDDSFAGYEFVADVDFYRYFLVVEYGGWSRNEDALNGVYQNDGTYFRAGIDVNFIKDDPDQNVFFSGYSIRHIPV